MSKSKFVEASKIIKISADVTIERNDIGIVEREGVDSATVFFIRTWGKISIQKRYLNYFDENKTGDAFPKKICNICHKLLDTSLFDRNQNGINNRPVRRPSCKNCRKILDGMNVKLKIKGEWTKNRPNKVPFECPICRKRTIAGITCKIVLDHNHLTGKPRAWICDSCNTGIGRFKDDIAILQRAIKFLE